MLQAEYSFEDLKMSSQIVRDLIARNTKLDSLIENNFDLDMVLEQIKRKKFSLEDRRVLVEAIRSQNENIELTQSVEDNISALLLEKTYTITAGHQLNLMTGPLYSIYKIIQSIALTQELNQRHPDLNFVPVFWMATEDHDFDEINHVHLFSKKISWEKDDQKDVVVGRILTQKMRSFLVEIEGMFQDPEALKRVQNLTKYYRESSDLATATRKLLNRIMGHLGLVILDGDDASLKKRFATTMQKEVTMGAGFTQVSATNTYLEKHHYHQQVFVRECNLFYIDEKNSRHRIIKTEDHFEINGAERKMNDIVAEIGEYPERFSPNALYRPLYQETILPNVVFVGGGGEVAYWLQLKSLFDSFGLVFPMLRVRDSILLFRQNQAQLMEDLNLELMDVKLGVDQIVKAIAMANSELDLKLTKAEAELFKAKLMVMKKVYEVDSNLESMVEAEFSKMIKGMRKIESKLIKAEKSKHEQTQKKLGKLRSSFFPEGDFQERRENFLPYYLGDEDFVLKILATLKSSIEPKLHLIEI